MIVSLLEEGIAHVQIFLEEDIYCRCTHYHVDGPPEFSEKTYTEEVAGFACGLIWSAWRLTELHRLGLAGQKVDRSQHG